MSQVFSVTSDLTRLPKLYHFVLLFDHLAIVGGTIDPQLQEEKPMRYFTSKMISAAEDMALSSKSACYVGVRTQV